MITRYSLQQQQENNRKCIWEAILIYYIHSIYFKSKQQRQRHNYQQQRSVSKYISTNMLAIFLPLDIYRRKFVNSYNIEKIKKILK